MDFLKWSYWIFMVYFKSFNVKAGAILSGQPAWWTPNCNFELTGLRSSEDCKQITDRNHCHVRDLAPADWFRHMFWLYQKLRMVQRKQSAINFSHWKYPKIHWLIMINNPQNPYPYTPRWVITSKTATLCPGSARPVTSGDPCLLDLGMVCFWV